MKKGLLILLALVAVWPLSAQQETEAGALWNRANTAYVNGDYKSAILHYDSIAGQGKESYKLYYNLGNAWFKEGNIGRAILNYNRALRISPSNKDARYNLKIANAYIKDNIESVPELMVVRWLRDLRATLSSNAWAVLSIVSFVLLMVAVLGFLLTKIKARRKGWFYGGMVLLLLFVMQVTFSAIGRSDAEQSSRAIVMDGAVSVKSSPDGSSKEIFILHEGTRVSILEKLGSWCEISIADGKIGWIEASSIEAI